jgi:photosystem II stability/assembly factor-like uncharacterized protein
MPTRFLVLAFLSLSGLSFGQSLHIFPTELPASFRGLSVVSDKVVWVSGSMGTVGRTADGGQTWKMAPIPGYEKVDFRSLYAFDSLQALVANAGSPMHVLRTNDGGRSWTKTLEVNDSLAFADAIDFWNDQQGLLLGDPIGGKPMVYETKDGGKTWSAVPSVGLPDWETGEASFAASGSTLQCLPDGKAWIASGGIRSRLWKSTDFGRSWTPVRVPIIQGKTSTGIYGMHFLPTGQAIVVGGDYTVDSLRTKHVYYSSNGGLSWAFPKVATRGYRESVVCAGGETWLAAGPSGIDISRDGGKHWLPFSDEKGFHALRKARKGEQIWLAGAKGKRAVLRNP